MLRVRRGWVVNDKRVAADLRRERLSVLAEAVAIEAGSA